jgi:hypothetical protein
MKPNRLTNQSQNNRTDTAANQRPVRYLDSFFKSKLNDVQGRDLPESILFQHIHRAHDGLNVLFHNVGIDFGGFYIGMAHQLLQHEIDYTIESNRKGSAIPGISQREVVTAGRRRTMKLSRFYRDREWLATRRMRQDHFAFLLKIGA